jgi:hypothetical protein
MMPETRQEAKLRNLCQITTTSKLWWWQGLRDPRLTFHRSVCDGGERHNVVRVKNVLHPFILKKVLEHVLVGIELLNVFFFE